MPFITILSQPEAEAYQPSGNEVLISIATPSLKGTKYPQPQLDNWAGREILRLSFHDSEPKKHTNPEFKHMSEYDAQMIACFCTKHTGKDIAIHCWAGRSRSLTIAELVVQLKFNEGYDFANYVQRPRINLHVYNLAQKAFRERAMEAAILKGFLKYQMRGDIHEEEKGMSSQMYEAGWNDAVKYLEEN